MNHGDPDNVWKGICDALFKNDKRVAGRCDFDYAKDAEANMEVHATSSMRCPRLNLN
jgi:hypothetical protein